MRRVPKGQGSLCAGCIMVNEKESVKKRIHELREQIEYHTHLYYDLDAPKTWIAKRLNRILNRFGYNKAKAVRLVYRKV